MARAPKQDKPKAKRSSAGHGGRRPGSGRKTSAFIKMRADLDAAVRDTITGKVPDLLRNLFRLADGIMLKDVSDDGLVDYYTTAPDRASNEYLLNRVLGKPTERYEHDITKLTDEELLAIVSGGP